MKPSCFAAVLVEDLSGVDIRGIKQGHELVTPIESIDRLAPERLGSDQAASRRERKLVTDRFRKARCRPSCSSRKRKCKQSQELLRACASQALCYSNL